MASVLQLISQSLKDAGILGVGQTAQPEDTNDAFTKLNQMIALWAVKRQLVYALRTQSIVSTGADIYSIGPGGDLDVLERPNTIESAFVRYLTTGNQIDYPLKILKAREDFNRIALKSLVTWPDILFYSTLSPLGFFHIWPIPTAGKFSIHLSFRTVLTQFSSLAEDVSLPFEYELAIQTNLARRLRNAYQLPPDPELNSMAKDSLEAIRTAYLQIPLMSLPAELIRAGSGYNVFSDRVR